MKFKYYDASEKQEDKLLENYWNYMAMRIVSLWGRNGITAAWKAPKKESSCSA